MKMALLKSCLRYDVALTVFIHLEQKINLKHKKLLKKTYATEIINYEMLEMLALAKEEKEL